MRKWRGRRKEGNMVALGDRERERGSERVNE